MRAVKSTVSKIFLELWKGWSCMHHCISKYMYFLFFNKCSYFSFRSNFAGLSNFSPRVISLIQYLLLIQLGQTTDLDGTVDSKIQLSAHDSGMAPPRNAKIAVRLRSELPEACKPLHYFTKNHINLQNFSIFSKFPTGVPQIC